MAVRLINLHRQPLRVDLRGGEVLVLPPGARSDALREELLYDNTYLLEWERAGWITRTPAKMEEVLRAEAGAPPVQAEEMKAEAKRTGKGTPRTARGGEEPEAERPAVVDETGRKT